MVRTVSNKESVMFSVQIRESEMAAIDAALDELGFSLEAGGANEGSDTANASYALLQKFMTRATQTIMDQRD
jgi:hypothetical protein